MRVLRENFPDISDTPSYFSGIIVFYYVLQSENFKCYIVLPLSTIHKE